MALAVSLALLLSNTSCVANVGLVLANAGIDRSRCVFSPELGSKAELPLSRCCQ